MDSLGHTQSLTPTLTVLALWNSCCKLRNAHSRSLSQGDDLTNPVTAEAPDVCKALVVSYLKQLQSNACPYHSSSISY